MDKTIAGLIGAVGALAMGTAGQASAAPAHAVLEAASYSELLRPIPNAAATLAALDSAEAVAGVEQVQYYYPYAAPYPNPYYYRRYHHHHHHHGYGRY